MYSLVKIIKNNIKYFSTYTQICTDKNIKYFKSENLFKVLIEYFHWKTFNTCL